MKPMNADFFRKKYECGIYKVSQLDPVRPRDGIGFTFFLGSEPIHLEFAGNQIKINPRTPTLFWTAIPYNIISMQGNIIQYIFTIPMIEFLKLSLSDSIIHDILNGTIFIENNPDSLAIDIKMFPIWIQELNSNDDERHITFEKSVIARVNRFFSHSFKTSKNTLLQEYHPNSKCLMTSNAIRLLLTTDLKIIDIAMESGFESISSFYKSFKDVCGRRPGEYRRLAKATILK